MKKLMLLLVVGSVVAAPAAWAGEAISREGKIWMGIGALVGALAGPVGAVAGAGGGAMLGERLSHAAQLPETRLALEESRQESGRLRQDLADARLQVAGMRERLARGVEQELVADSVEMEVFFRTGSSDPGQEERERLERFARLLAGRPGLQLELEGHADPRGDEQFNQLLSEQRVEAVRALLLAAGVGDNRIRGTGLGESRATAGDGDLDAYAMERRVVLRLAPAPAGMSASSHPH